METLEKKSLLSKVGEKIYVVLAVLFVLFHMYTAFFGAFPGVTQKGIHLGAILLLFFLSEMASDKNKMWYRIFSIIVGIAGVVGCAYYVLIDAEMQNRLGVITKPDTIFGIMLLVVVIIAAYRVVGASMCIVTLVFIAYGFLGKYMHGILRHQGLNMRRFINLLLVTSDGVWGTPLYASALYIVLFIILGAVMQETGIGDYLTYDTLMKLDKIL
ncbi:MAG: hypothetical protein MJ171_04305, partial [Clostridia bacterium]|nr:hypothetical protein [Clostridia bacterium]